MKSNVKKFIFGVCTLSGTIIGVGLFSLPYIAVQSGTWLVIGYFIGLGALAIIMQLIFSDIALKTPDFLRSPGFANFHLGKWGKRVSLASFVIGMFGVLLSYLILGGKFFSDLLSPYFGGSELMYTLIYFALGSIIIFFGIGMVSKIEFLGLVLFFGIMIVIFFRGLPCFELSNVYFSADRGNLFLPYGPILFSLWGVGLIPEIEEMLGKDKYLLKKIVPVAVIIPVIAYISFIFIVVGVSGEETSVDAIEGLRRFLDNRIINLVLAFGLLTTFTSFIILGLTLKKTLWYDLKMNKNLSCAIACFVPLFLFLIGFSFLGVISFVGAITIGIDGILILLMYQKLKGRKAFKVTIPLMLIFMLAIAYKVIYLFK